MIRVVDNDDRGSGDVLGLVLMAPMMVAFAMLVFFLGRQVDSHSQVRSAAAAAAEAGALQRTPDLARQVALAAAQRAVSDPTACVGGPAISVDLSDFMPGGVVRVTVTCTAATSDLANVDAHAQPFSASAVATVDAFRASAP